MKKIIILAIIVNLAFCGYSQFYNGHQMNFGKNRVQYKPFSWRYYRTQSYDIYVYDRGLNFGKYVKSIIDEEFEQMSSFFGISIRERMYFIVYNKLSEFRQSNIGLQNDNLESNIGGQFQIIKNKVFLYYESDHPQFRRQLRKILAQLYINQALYGSAFFERVSSSTIANIPSWFEQGLASYVAEPYNFDVFNRLNDVLNNKKHVNFNHLQNQNAEILGHCFWFFIAENYGNQSISNIIYFTKISHNIKRSIEYVLGKKMRTLTREYENYWRQNLKIQNPSNFDNQNNLKITKNKRTYNQIKINPDAQKVAFVQNFDGRYKIIVYNLETQKKQVIFRQGQRLQQIVENSYPVISWNNKGNILAFTTEDQSIVTFWMYNFEKKELKSIVLPNITKVVNFSFSPTSPAVVFSAVSDGYTDLFLLNPQSSSFERLSYDLPDDLDPCFDVKGENIVFASNRLVDTFAKIYRFENNLKIANNYNLYQFNLNTKSNKLIKLTNTKFSNPQNPIAIGNNTYAFLSDSTGFTNRFVVKLDSTIAFVDTIVHYQYITNTYQQTNLNKSIINHHITKKFTANTIFDNKKYRFNLHQTSKNVLSTNSEVLPIKQKQNKIISKKLEAENQQIIKQIQAQIILDSLKPAFEKKINSYQNPLVDINKYKFEIETDTIFAKYYKENYLNKNEPQPSTKQEIEHLLVYKPVFFISDLMSQVDFSMLNQSYQPFTGGPYYFNPGFSLFTAFGVNELFENYKLLAGFRYSLNGSTEYIFSFEDLKKRIDKQIVFHRQVLKSITQESVYYFDVTKTISNELIYLLRYPFNQVSSVRASFIGKYDKISMLSLDYGSLIQKPSDKYYLGLKTEYIFDNTRDISINLLDGWRCKIFGEYYYQINDKNYSTFVVGGDLRFYKELFRDIVFASRLAGATSFGSGKVIFYLGGVDNWYDLSFDTTGMKYFDKTVRLNPNENYIFQAVATNLRGFPQNIRNGNSFVLSNMELRVPIFRAIMPFPINSDFWYHFQVVGFFDIGSAWSGISPYDKKNYYHTITEVRPPFVVTVDLERPPLVYGYGFGFRSKLFGYFVRIDYAWGTEAYFHYPYKFYISLSADF